MSSAVPRVGVVATIRNRRGVVSAVHPSEVGADGVLHLVTVEYNDGETPLAESLVWEREPASALLPPSALPQPDAHAPMPVEDLTALVRACRWSARTPFVDPDGAGPMARLPVSSPFHGAVQVEDYQLMPLLKALRMPRVSLLIADDVGLGKTIEAGLIMSELLLRRRIRRVLIITPAALRVQWKEEMWEKFSLEFEVVDRTSTMRMRRQLGMDANPWRSNSRIIASYHYLKQPDVLEQFRSVCQREQGGAHLPWDLLIVDEAHNLTPAPYGDDSDLCTMLRQLAPNFEHKIFLTATPHNGHTRSFTGLLELLDPVRFTQKDEMSANDKLRVSDVVVRRLKREINARSTPKRFCDRLPPEALVLQLSPEEKRLSDAFAAFRAAVSDLFQSAGKQRRLAGNFAVEILGKRLLSCPLTFSDSWLRCRQGMDEPDEVSEAQVLSAQRAVEEETTDDQEAARRVQTASTTVGAWLRPLVDSLATEIADIDQCVSALGISADKPAPDQNPLVDSRFDTLVAWIQAHLHGDATWQTTERLVLFTEYKVTLDYLLRRLRERYPQDEERFLSLYGGMPEQDREAVKQAFNDGASPVRILIGTDAASEGLNLQQTARYLIHYDVPWNPSRVEQRNGRLDRHGQARDVHTYHFVSPENQDLKFLDLVVDKVHTIREDLGATGQVFDELTHRRLVRGESLESVRRELDQRLDRAKKATEFAADATTGASANEVDDSEADLTAIAAELDFDPHAMRLTLDAAMALATGRPRIGEPDAEGRSALVHPTPPTWAPVIDDAVRLPPSAGARRGSLPHLAFDPQSFVVSVGGRPVFRARSDTLLVHLGHPLIQRALSALTRLRFPGGTTLTASRWTVVQGELPPDTEAVVRLTIEELAVNELRETFHHWVRTVAFPVKRGALAPPLPHQPANTASLQASSYAPNKQDLAADLWLDVEADVKQWLAGYLRELDTALQDQLRLDGDAAVNQETARYQSRQGEVSALIASNTISRLERELAELRAERRDFLPFLEKEFFDQMDRDIKLKEDELRRRRRHYDDIGEQLKQERDRILNHVLPKRYHMRGKPQLMPIAVEIILPGGH